MPLLETCGLTVTFGGLRAVDSIDLTVEAGKLVGLIGPNGAGKTTFIDAVTGFVPADGSVRFAGAEMLGRQPHQRARAGLSRTWQSVELFDDLTVQANLQVACEQPPWWGFLADLVAPRRKAAADGVRAALDVFDLASLADRLPSELSHGQRKLVGVARALAAEPQLICMDEPAAGLDSGESRSLGAHLRSVVEQGTTILLVDHDMGLVLEVCDYIYVIEFGSVIAQGTPREIRQDPEVIRAYLGQGAVQGAGGSATGEDGGVTVLDAPATSTEPALAADPPKPADPDGGS